MHSMTVVPELNVCLINPALLPSWFWLPTAYALESAGVDAHIPTIPRDNPASGVEDCVDTIEDAVGDLDNQFIVCLSRGVEYSIRYLHRLSRQNQLDRVAGWMVISSVGPKGYECNLSESAIPMQRHSDAFCEAVWCDDQGLERMDEAAAEEVLLHDIDDIDLRATTLSSLVPTKRLSEDEIAALAPASPQVPISWHIGLNDRVDNTALSAALAEQHFGIVPTYHPWGHVAPLSHTAAVAETIIAEARKALDSNKGQPS